MTKKRADTQDSPYNLKIQIPKLSSSHPSLGKFQGGLKLLEQGNFAEAEAVFEYLKAKTPDEPAMYNILAFISMIQCDFRQAYERYKLFQKRFPENIDTYIGMGNALLGQGKIDAAEAFFILIQQKFPDQPKAYEPLMYLSMQKRHFRQASEHYRRFLEKFPEKFSTYLGLGYALLEQGSLDEAETVFQQCIDKFPEEIEGYKRHAIVAALKMQHEQFEARCQNILDKFSNKADIFIQVGDLCNSSVKLLQALSFYKKSILKYPHLSQAFIRYSDILFELKIEGASAEHRDIMENMIKLHPLNSEAHYAYGKFSFRLGNFQTAKEHLHEALALNSSCALALYLLLEIAQIEQEDKKVAEYFNKLKSLGQQATAKEPVWPQDAQFTYRDMLPQHRTLKSILGHGKITKPKIVDAADYPFTNEQKNNMPVVALFAIALPRPKLDVLYMLYKMLKTRNYNVLLFLDARNLSMYDFAEVLMQEDDVCFAAHPKFFHIANFIKCIITNDGILEPDNLPKHCSLVYHAPHNTNLSPLREEYNKAHYITWLKGQELMPFDEKLYNPHSYEKRCFIRNHYTKNEYLLEFLTTFKSPIKAIAYCPSFLNETHFKDIPVMLQAILDNFAEYYVIFRPKPQDIKQHKLIRTLLKAFSSEKRFLFDTYTDSKFTLAVSDILITNYSGMANTFAEIKQTKYIAFYPDLEKPALYVNNQYDIYCTTPEEVVQTIKKLLAEQLQHPPLKPEEMSPELREYYTGITYLADNIDYILEDKIHPDWLYAAWPS